MRRFLAVLLLALLLAPAAQAEVIDVWVQDGDVWSEATGGATKRLTQAGDVSLAAWSHDRKWVAYLRPVENAPELWLVEAAGGSPRRLLVGKPDDDPKRDLSEIYELDFGVNNDRLYFRSSGWATSGAIHEIDLRSGAERFLIDGNDILVEGPKGAERGYLLVERHGYYPGGGSYEAVWLVTPDGKPVRRWKGR